MRSRKPENEAPTQRDIDQLKERIGEYNEEITRLWKTLSPIERGWVDLPDEEVAKLRRRMSECGLERERLTSELAEVLSRSA
jgi:predicted  nucleic acid-binding Zn-ribbon protein